MVIHRPHKGAWVGAYQIIEEVGHGADGLLIELEELGVNLGQRALVFAVRSPIESAWSAPRNRHLLGSVVVSVALVFGAVYLPFLHEPLGTVSLRSGELAVVALLAVMPFVCVEAGKALARRAGWRLEGVTG